jgi:hypothetical protein
MRTIYKKVYEKLRGEREVVDVDNIFGDVHIHPTNSMVEITEEEFKKSLGSKTPVNLSVYRETFVIEVDEERGKIIAKKYTVVKNTSYVKKINKTTLRSTKTYASLTFDLKTREFSIFRASTNTKNIKSTPFIRKNIITHQVLCFVEDFFNFGHVTETESLEGLNLIAEYLGHGITVSELCDIYDYRTAIDHKSSNLKAKDQAKFFVLFNHLSATGLYNTLPINMLEVAFNFKHDRKKYFGKTIYEYYAEQLEIDDVSFVRSALVKKDFFNAAVLRSKREAPVEEFLLVDNTHFMGVDIFGLKILYHLGYSADQILNSKVFEPIIFPKNMPNYHSAITPDQFDLAKKLTALEIKENIDFFRLVISKDSFIPTAILEVFNLRKKIEVIYGLKIDVMTLVNNTNLMNRIEGLLHQVTEKTGVYAVSNRFLNKLKKHLPEGSTISVGKKYIDSEKIYESNQSTALITIKHKKEIYKMYVDDNGVKWYNRVGDEDRISIFEPTPKKTKITELSKGVRSFEVSLRKSVRQIPLRAKYSKKYFEHLLGDVITRNEYENIIKNLVYLDK